MVAWAKKQQRYYATLLQKQRSEAVTADMRLHQRGRILISLKSGLSTSLAVQMAQRIFGLYPGVELAAVRHSDSTTKAPLMYINDQAK
jgi:hypothetical protein